MITREIIRKTLSISVITVLFLLLSNNIIFAQSEQIRMLSYNVLTYKSSDGRDGDFQTVLSSIDPLPDLIAICEIDDNTSGEANNFLNNVLDAIGTYNMGTFVSSGHSDVNTIYYNPSKFTFLSTQLIVGYSATANHPTYEYQLYNNLTGDKIHIFGVHLSSNNSTDRDANATVIRTFSDQLPSSSYFIAAGDFNLANGNEAAYATLTDNGTGSGYFLDAVNLTGSWNADSVNFIYQTYSTDDMRYRYDLMLNSQSVVDGGGVTYAGNFTAYGNDGLHHELGIRQYGSTGLPNQAVHQAVANALYNASDHLPVFADYTFAVPNPVNPPYQGSIAFTQVGVSDGSNPDEIEFVTLYRMDLTTLKITNNMVNVDNTLGTTGGTYDLSNTSWTDVPEGTHVRLGISDDNDVSDGILAYDGQGSGTLPTFNSSGGNQVIAYTGSSSSPTYIAGLHWGTSGGWPNPSYAPGTASDIALGSDNYYYFDASLTGTLYTDRNNLIDSGNWVSSTSWIDYQSPALPVELSSFSGRIIKNEVYLQWRTETEVNNYGFEIQRSVDKISWSKIGFVQGHGNSNSPKDYSFTDKSLPDGTIYYRLKQEDLDGKFEYSNVINVNYKGAKDVVLYQNYPNPFNPTTKIEYLLPTSSRVSLKVYDILGREIVELKNNYETAGKYSVNFDGTNLASGIYFYVLVADNFTISKKMSILH